jgi:hypothetical protein
LASRNLGLANSNSQVVAFVDDDFVVGELWGPSVYELFSDRGVVLATGPALPVWEGGYPPKWADFFTRPAGDGVTMNLIFSLLYQSEERIDAVDPSLVFGQNFVVRRDLLAKAPGFGPDLMPSRHWLFVGDGEFAVSGALSRQGVRAVLDSRGGAPTSLILKGRVSERWRADRDTMRPSRHTGVFV